MKLLTLVLFSSLIVAVLSTSVTAQRTTEPSLVVRSPEIVLKEFYKWYIHDVNGQRSNHPWKTTKTLLA